MEIVPEEAELIRTIFNWYCDGYGVSMIAKKLSMMKIKTFKGNDKWADSSIRRILKNEKYKGDVLTRRSLYSNRKAVDPAWQCIQSVKFGKALSFFEYL